MTCPEIGSDLRELREDLLLLLERRLLDPLEILTASPALLGPLRQEFHDLVGEWAHQLLGADDQVAAATVSRLLATLFNGDLFAPPAHWWRTPFGRIVARRVGYPGRSAVSGPEAAAMLGISRQGVHDLLRRGKLDRAADGGVRTASIQARLAAAI